MIGYRSIYICTYMNCTIERMLPSGMYRALTSQGSVRADTMTGIKRMIREREKPRGNFSAQKIHDEEQGE